MFTVSFSILLALSTNTFYTNPVLDRDFPDPTVIKAGDGKYYAYGTMTRGIHLQAAVSDNLVNWTYHGEVFPELGNWTNPSGSCTWAPDVQYHPGEKWEYVMYYAGSSQAGCKDFCIGVAVSSTPLGPFRDTGAPLICGPSFQHIDPKSFDDPNSGKSYVFWGSASFPLQMQELRKDRMAFSPGSKAVTVLLPNSSNPYESLVEGSWITYHKPSGYYFYYYSGNACCGAGANYAVMVARSKSISGPFEKKGVAEHSHSSTILEKTPRATADIFFATGHNGNVFDDAGDEWMFYHAYYHDPTGAGPRTLLMDKIQYIDHGPELGTWPVVGTNGSASATPQPVPVVK
eukprot:m.343055 g.343055  ORF g.343055 m.343055 type:complete len:345 (+) comp22265_c0_seq1:100-1134(+)